MIARQVLGYAVPLVTIHAVHVCARSCTHIFKSCSNVYYEPNDLTLILLRTL